MGQASHVLDAYGGGWQARLNVGITRVAGRSVASHVSHEGPLRIQKVLWPEGPDLAHLILLHPPSGMAGGDSAELTVSLADECRALLTTPGAGRWYRGDTTAMQHVQFTVGARASLEWLPQETVLHDGVQGEQVLSVQIDQSAAAIGMEVLVLGRKASGERLLAACFRSRLSLRRGDRSLLGESARIGKTESGAAALGAAHVSGLLWAVSPVALSADLAEAVEAAVDQSLGVPGGANGVGYGGAIGAASVVDPHLLLVRVVGSSPELLRRALVAAWSVVRPVLVGRAAVLPRIWMT